MIGWTNGKPSLNKMCRLCMKEENAMSSIFTDDTGGVLAYKILYCLSLKVFQDDGLPMFICAQCIYQLNCTFEFKTQCEHSDSTLRKYINETSAKTEVKEEHQNQSTEHSGTSTSCTVQQEQNKTHSDFASNVACVGQFPERNSCSNNNEMYVKLENTEEMAPHFSSDTTWNYNKMDTDFEMSNNVNKCTTNINEEQVEDINIIDTNVVVTNIRTASVSVIENRPQTKLSRSVPNYSTNTSTVIDKITAPPPEFNRVAQINLKFNERTETVEGIFSKDSSYMRKMCHVLMNSETNQNPKKPYTCQWCFQSYAGRSGLWQHIQKHTGRQYVCSVCDRRFTRGNILKHHERTHSLFPSHIT